jgi:hypothetical protein
MVKLELLSKNIPLMLEQILNSREITKYLTYNQKNPLSQVNTALPANGLMFKNVFPYPFDSTATLEDCSQVRVYYSNGYLDTREITHNTQIVFDIIVAKSLWLVNDGVSLVRPYEIMKHIVALFSDKSVGTLGKINFHRFVHLTVNDKFNAIRLEASMLTIGTG